MTEAVAIVVFDGDCGLCNGFVAWLIRRDRRRRFLIAGSAGAPGRAVLEAGGLPASIAASSLVVWDGKAAALRSDAVARVTAGLPWPWRAGMVLRAVPRRMRDAVYDAVARRRPRRPAEDPACGTPPPGLAQEWRSRLASVEDARRLPQLSAGA
ncbi:DCC1-like thiol-disulfide oxidoreductase family protein [Demequina sp. SYSU T00039]|uniref:DCC1-like thiol-disulfide oxidoreductase family protein n=1 Tax=Demequina lignilytica TaxID=3051663 RepID=A0AAW7M7N4_9MICO|nr:MULTISPECIES: DCC1-like thiol-disulfide oxidoreductase family protein [unclassified Demequina]MDN4478333.1 DCC1-like thiol-disulfide oxidoreductase family protein [Demequina sp. SYSU T00039-1]MDN4487160.1 DCC1-like thiol-disulfide oxidoreductase family protein [Demequina sp. SYSU T00039]